MNSTAQKNKHHPPLAPCSTQSLELLDLARLALLLCWLPWALGPPRQRLSCPYEGIHGSGAGGQGAEGHSCNVQKSHLQREGGGGEQGAGVFRLAIDCMLAPAHAGKDTQLRQSPRLSLLTRTATCITSIDDHLPTQPNTCAGLPASAPSTRARKPPSSAGRWPTLLPGRAQWQPQQHVRAWGCACRQKGRWGEAEGVGRWSQARSAGDE